MNVIANLRGGGGSGKTTAFRHFLELPHRQVMGPNLHTKSQKDEVKGYVIRAESIGIKVPIFMMGSYEANCGGTDKIKKQQEIVDRGKEWFGKGYHVIFEGLLVSKLGPKGTVTNGLYDVAQERLWFLFLDTPEELALERVLQRRKERGDEREFDPNKSFYRDHRATRMCKANLEGAGFACTAWINHENPYDQLCDFLRWGEKRYG